MLLLTSHITIGDLSITWVHDIEIETSWDLLTDKAKIILPANVLVKTKDGANESMDRNKISKYIKAGDPINIELGYDGKLNQIYKGFVTYVKPKVPVEIHCEDEMWKLKQNSINDSGKGAKLSDIMAKHFSAYKTNILDVELGAYYIDGLSQAKYLDYLKKDYGLRAFFRDGVLNVGTLYDKNTAKNIAFTLNYNIVSEDLEYKSKDQVKLKVKAISNNPNGSKLTIELGDQDGESRTLNFYNLPEAELKAAAEREMERLSYDGWRGSFTAFGFPIVKHGDIVELKSELESDKTGNNWVDAVSYKFGVGGFRQEIKLGPRT